MAAPKVNLQVLRTNASANLVGFKFKLMAYENGVVVNRFRVVVYAAHRWQQGDFTWSLQDGWETFGGASGGVRISSVSSLTHDAPSHPPCFKVGKIFRDMMRCRLEGFNGLTTLNADQGVGGCELTMRNTAYKDYQVNNLGQRIYESAYSYISSTSYVDTPRFVLEYNEVDPDVVGSSNWVVVSEVTDTSGTPDANTGAHPYAGDTGSNYASTNTDHLFTAASLFNLIDSANPNNAYTGAQTYEIHAAKWNGSANSTTRALLGFDLGLIQNKQLLTAALIWWNEPVDSTHSQIIDICDLTEAFTESSTWNTHNNKIADAEGYWTEDSNSSNAQSTLGVAPMSLAYLQSVASSPDDIAYLCFKYRDESTQKYMTIASRWKTDTAKRPYILINYDPNSVVGVNGSGDLSLPPITVSGTGARSGNGTGNIPLPNFYVYGVGEVRESISGASNIALGKFSISGSGFKAKDVVGSGSIVLGKFSLPGVGAKGDAPIIVSISAGEGRWDEVITMRIANITMDTFLTIDGVECPFVTIDGEVVTWIVPRIPIGPRTLEVKRRSA